MIDTDNKNIELLVNRILSGRHIFSYDSKKYELKKPSLDIKIKADLLYEEAYNDNLFGEFLLLEDIPNFCIETGIISYNYSQQNKELEKKLENSKVDYFLYFIDIDKRKKQKTKLENIKKQYSNFLEIIHSFDYISLEHYCSKIKNEFVITNTLYYYDTNILVFDNTNPIDYIYFNTLVNEINKNLIDIDTYKHICRSEYWKNLWSDNKHSIIKDPVSEWSEEQKTLCNLSRMYDRIYEHPECPSEEVIADNDALDGWMIYQKRQNSKQKQEKGVHNMLPEKIRNSSEVFLMAGNKEKAESIMEFNDKQALSRISQKINFVHNNSEPVREAELPDVHQELMNQLRQQTKGR